MARRRSLRRRELLVAAMVTAFAPGCATAPRQSMRELLERSFCAPPRAFREFASTAPTPLEPDERAALARRFSMPSIEIAEVIGGARILQRIAQLEHGGSPSDLAAERERLATRIESAERAVESSVAELGCEHERVVTVAQALRGEESSNTRAYTVVALLVTAVTGIVTSALTPVPSTAPTEAAIGIVGGIGGAVFGLGALLVHSSIMYRHPRNLLRDVFDGPDHSTLFAPVVWGYLSDPRFSVDRAHSIRANLVSGWIALGRLGSQSLPDPRLVALYFGDGGRYDVDSLDARAAMLSELRSAVELMHQDLLLLSTAMTQEMPSAAPAPPPTSGAKRLAW